jgi:hypothetical protein
MSIIQKFGNQSINPTKDMIFKDLGKNLNVNNTLGVINSLCGGGYIYENDGLYYLN